MGASCGNSAIDHAIQVVGKSGPNNDYPIFTIRNSWGTGWGENGFARIQFQQTTVTTLAHGTITHDNCAIGGSIMYPIINPYPYGPDTCKPGFVWREAVAGDHVCVTGATRAQVLADNAAAASRRVSGSNYCIYGYGYVWREATNNVWMGGSPPDYVCVNGTTRALTQSDNQPATANSRWVIAHT
jgi:hypothetical protein